MSIKNKFYLFLIFLFGFIAFSFGNVSANENASYLENKVPVRVEYANLWDYDNAVMQSIYYKKGCLYLIPKGTYEDDGTFAVLVTDRVIFSNSEINNLIVTDWDCVLIVQDSLPEDMNFTIAGVSFYELTTSLDGSWDLSDFENETVSFQEKFEKVINNFIKTLDNPVYSILFGIVCSFIIVLFLKLIFSLFRRI